MSPLRALQRGEEVSDVLFDSLYPPQIRKLSEVFWTPVAVARRAAAFLAPSPGMRVLDVGSGVGKFCLVAACTSAGIFEGIEQRLSLVEVAREQIQGLESPPQFHHGDMRDIDWSHYAGVYLYNPFCELTSGPWCKIDRTLRFDRELQNEYIECVVAKLEGMPGGTRVATYFGFGGTMPAGFQRITPVTLAKSPLVLWSKG